MKEKNMHTTSTTRGVSFDPNVARRQRKVEQEIRQAEIDRQVRMCYAEHMPGQRRYLGAKRAGVVS
jgi:hypothetical protein